MHNKKLVLRWDRNFFAILCIVVVLFGSLGPFSKYRMVPSFLLFAILLLNISFNQKKFKICSNFVPWILFIIYLIINSLLFNLSGGINYLIMPFVGVLLVATYFDILDIKFLCRLLCVGSFVFALFTYANKSNPNIILDFFGNFIHDGQKITIERDLYYGGIPGLAGESSFNAFFISYGLFYAAACLVINFNFSSLIYICFLMGAVFLTGKRSFLLLDSAIIFLCILIGIRRKYNIKRTYFYGSSSVVVLALSPLLYKNVYSILTKGGSSIDLSNRNWFWEMAFELFRKNPILGSGINTYDYLYNSRKQGLSYIAFAGAHNSYIQLLAETGIVGEILFLIAIGGAIFFSIKCIANTHNSKYIVYAIFSVISQIFILIYAFTENPFYQPQQFIFYFLTLSICFNVDRCSDNDELIHQYL